MQTFSPADLWLTSVSPHSEKCSDFECHEQLQYDIQHSSTFHNPYKAAPAFQKANRKNTDLQDSAARISKELHNLQNLQSQDATTGNHKSICIA